MSASGHTGSFSSSPNFGVGVTWEGVTWTVTPRVTSGGVNYDGTPQSVTVPSISVNVLSITRGSAATVTTSTSNAIGGTLYWAATPANQFNTSQGTVERISSFSNITASSSSTATSGTVSVYVHSSRGASDLVASDTFSIANAQQTITTLELPLYHLIIQTSPNVTVTVTNNSSTRTGGTLQFAQTTTNSSSGVVGRIRYYFTHPRNETRYYWARRSANNVSK